MWRSLRDPALIRAYESEFGTAGAPRRLVLLLKSLAAHERAERLYAVTSLRQLRFTTAPDYTQEERHPFVTVSENDTRYAIAYFEAGSSRPTASKSCTESEMSDVVESYLLRLVLS